MKRIATANRAVDLFGAGKDGFKAAVPGVSDPTYCSPQWFNYLQESIVRTIEQAGMTPSDDYDQFAKALTVVMSAQVALAAGQVALATVEKIGAQTARTAAELAQGVAFGSTNIKPSTAAGISDTNGTMNKFFSIISGVATESIIIYENVSGTATERKRVLSSDAAWSYKGEIASGTSLNALTKAGTYYGAAGSTIADKPTAFNGIAFQLFIYDGFGVNSRFQLQEIRQWNLPNNCFRRWFDSTNQTANAWIGNNVNDGVINALKLSDDYNYRGITTVNANSFIKAGTYFVNASILNLPSGAPVQGYLEVAVAQDGFLMQTYSGLTDPSKSWKRYIRSTTSTYGAWTSTLGVFAGKKIAFIGDSITHLGDYPARVAARLGCTSLQMGFAGCTMSQRADIYDSLAMYKIADAIASGNYSAQTTAAASLTTSTGTNYNTPAALLASTDWSTVDYLVIAFGTNDWGVNLALGTDTSADGTTFKGAINYTINKILTAFPNIKILFSGPMWRARQAPGDGLDSDTVPRTDGKFLIEFTDAVKAVAALNKIPALDMYRTNGINKYNAASMLADGLHPIAGIGYQRIADKIASALESNY